MTLTEDAVYAKFVDLALSWNPIGGAINIANLSRLLKASKYQTRKHVHALRDKGMVELKCFSIPDEEEIYPPYWGYLLTEKGRDTDHFRQQNENNDRILTKLFS